MPADIPARESLTVEFKSDREPLSERDLAAAVVCMANTDGGAIYLGVEEGGRVGGLHSSRRDANQLESVIFNRTNPPLRVSAEVLQVGDKRVARIDVPKSLQLVATSAGLIQRRRLMADGTPECVPFYPHEFTQRQSDLGLLDYSARPVDGATARDLDPLARERARQILKRYQGDTNLLQLTDEQMDGALGLVRQVDGQPRPTVAGLLLLGREDALQEHLPTHEIAFQVLEETEVRVNNFYRTPLVDVFDRMMEHFNARAEEREMQVGMFRVPVPQFDRRAFREGLANAVVHRDYTRLGAIHVRWRPDAVEISNPGGLVEGVTLENLLVTEPRPRNPLLADAFKRLGLVERTGRGVSIIYEGMLRYGRPPPDYGRTTRTSVVLQLPGGEADLTFLELVIEEEQRTNQPMPVDALIALRALRDERRLDTTALAAMIQKDIIAARRVLERLTEAGLADARGARRDRTYLLSPAVYRRWGESAAYVRQRGFDRLQEEQMVSQFVNAHGRITRREVADLCKVDVTRAGYVLRRMVQEGKLKLLGRGRGAYYVRNGSQETQNS